MLDILRLIFNYFVSIINFLGSFEIVEGLSIMSIVIILSLLSFAVSLIKK